MKIKGRRAFGRRLKRIPKAVRLQVVKDLNLGADEMVDVAKRFAPKDTLGLEKSIRKEKGNRRLQVKVKAGGAATTRAVRNGVKATYDYALADEFGTEKMTANPFFWPAYRLTKRRRKSRITRNANKIIKRIFAA